MRPVSLALPPLKPTDLARVHHRATATTGSVQLTWNDNSITETSFVVQRTTNGTTWTDVGTLTSPLGEANTHGHPHVHRRHLERDDRVPVPGGRVNTVGYGGAFPSMTVDVVLDPRSGVNGPAAPTPAHGRAAVRPAEGGADLA